MSDPFSDTLGAEEAAVGPFRTNEPTRDRRLERAREESLARVARATLRELEAERRRARAGDRIWGALLGASALVLAAVVALAARGGSGWLPLLCPAASLAVSLAIVVWRRERGVRGGSARSALGGGALAASAREGREEAADPDHEDDHADERGERPEAHAPEPDLAQGREASLVVADEL